MPRFLSIVLLFVMAITPVVVAANPVITFKAVVYKVDGVTPVQVAVGDTVYGRISYQLAGLYTEDQEEFGCRHWRFAVEPRSTFQVRVNNVVWLTTMNGNVTDSFAASACGDSTLEFHGHATSASEYPGDVHPTHRGTMSVVFEEAHGGVTNGNKLPSRSGTLPLETGNGFLIGYSSTGESWGFLFGPLSPLIVPARPSTWTNIKHLYR